MSERIFSLLFKTKAIFTCRRVRTFFEGILYTKKRRETKSLNKVEKNRFFYLLPASSEPPHIEKSLSSSLKELNVKLYRRKQNKRTKIKLVEKSARASS
jgi:hypothetical protein